MLPELFDRKGVPLSVLMQWPEFRLSDDSVSFGVLFSRDCPVVCGSIVRYFDPSRPKYIATGHAKSTLFGAWNLNVSTAFVVEGVFDCIRLQHLRLPAVAVLGTSISDIQQMFLRRYFKRLILAFDPDVTGERRSHHFLPVLKNLGIETHEFNCAPYRGAAEMSVALGATPFIEFLRKTRSMAHNRH